MRWDPERYDRSFGFVSAYGASLLDALGPRAGERILDLGCGTGQLAAAIAERGASVIGIDASPEMISKARAAFPGLRFEVADARRLTVDGQGFGAELGERLGAGLGEGLGEGLEAGFDAVFSNAALHWIPQDPDAVIRGVRDVLRPGGRFVAEFGGARNVATIIEAVGTAVRESGREPAPHPWHFPTPGEYVTRLEAGGLTVRHLDYFDRPTPLDDRSDGVADWVRMFGADLLAGVPDAEHPAILARVRELTEATLHRDGHWFADYVRLRFMATL